MTETSTPKRMTVGEYQNRMMDLEAVWKHVRAQLDEDCHRQQNDNNDWFQAEQANLTKEFEQGKE